MTAPSFSRRRASLLGLGAMAAGLVGFPLQPLRARTLYRPEAPATLTRRLSRGLRDGNAIVVTRAWKVTFEEQARGIAIAGEQIAVSVEAPSPLEPLARIEEQRSTQGMFPILLGPDGTIMAAGQNTSRSSFDAAVETAQSLLQRSGFGEDSVEQQGAYMARLQKAGSSLLDQLPGDLFYPSTQPFRDTQAVALPDGTQGAFEVTWMASVKDGTRLLETARREVITRIGETERRSSEEWALAVP
ncbi:MAG: hypothetical protein AAF251_05475 [Pseudomonadota bacterium]